MPVTAPVRLSVGGTRLDDVPLLYHSGNRFARRKASQGERYENDPLNSKTAFFWKVISTDPRPSLESLTVSHTAIRSASCSGEKIVESRASVDSEKPLGSLNCAISSLYEFSGSQPTVPKLFASALPVTAIDQD